MHVPSRIMDLIERGDALVITRSSASWYYTPDTPFWQGDVVERFRGVTYGCITPDGIACIRNGEGPFFEVPRDAVVRLTSEGIN
mgnify:CR=1 FL=1